MESVSQGSQSQNVKVELLLSGGHHYTLSLKSDAPLLHTLLKALVASAQNQASGQLLQIPMDEGKSVLCFPSDRLIGVITEPPVLLQQQRPTPSQTLPAPPPQTSPVLTSKYLQIDNFFSAEQWQSLLAYVQQKEAEFVPTTTATNAADYRKSMVLHSFPDFADLIREKVSTIFPEVCQKIGIEPFVISQIEAQLTSHNDGNFYKVHNDNGSSMTATRELTYVYYFYREPKAFSGGELRIYDSKIQNNFYVKTDSFHTVEPRNNSIVFFLSRYMHEVLPVQCPSQVFADSRFTINGWIRR